MRHRKKRIEDEQVHSLRHYNKMVFKKSAVVRTTNRQFEIMVDFLEQHPEMVGFAQETKAGRRKLWTTLTELLNQNGPPTRKTAEWKSIWADYKYNIKKKLRTDNLCAKRQGVKRLLFSGIETKVINMLKLKEKLCTKNYKLHQKPIRESKVRNKITQFLEEANSQNTTQRLDMSVEEENEESIVIYSDLESEPEEKINVREAPLILNSKRQNNSEPMQCDVTLTLNNTLLEMRRTQLEILKELKENNRQKNNSHYFKEQQLQLEREKFEEQKQQNLEANKRASLELELKRRELELYELKLRGLCTGCIVKTESVEYVVNDLN